MVLACSLFHGVGISCLRKPSQKSKQSPLQSSWLPSDPCPHSVCVQAVCLPGSTVLLCFISDTRLGFKTPYFRYPCSVDLCQFFWGRVSLHCGQCWFVSEISHVTVQWFRVYGKGQEKSQHQGLLPSTCVFVPMSVNRAAHWCCQFFCP